MNITLPASRLGRASIVMASLLALAACGSDNDDNPPAPTNEVSIVVPLSPSQEVPPVTADTATGEGNVVVNSETGALSGSVTVSGLTGPATMAHIHQAPAGENGPVIFNLEGNTDGTVWTIPADTVLDTPQLAAFLAGEMYFNVHTDANPGGELRGQIVEAAAPAPVEDTTFVVPLSPLQEVPPVTADNASGEGNVSVNSETGAISGSVTVAGLTGPATMAHIHQAPAGENGPVILNLESNDDGTVWSIPADTVLDTAQLAELLAGNLYFNVHTDANPGGELRGQIVQTTEFTVRIDNVSTAETLPTSAGSVAVPLSPGVYLVHRSDRNPLLDPRDPASAALEALAEDGDPSQFPAFVPGSAVFNTPVGADAPGPIAPGGYYTFTFRASAGDNLAIATMFVQSNDWFYSTTDDNNDSIPLFDAEGNAISGDVTSMLSLWESGTEVDEEPGTGPNQAPRQAGPNTGDDEGLTVGSLAGRGKSVTLNGDVIRVTITPN